MTQSSAFTGARSRCSLAFLELVQPTPWSHHNSNPRVPPWTSLGAPTAPAPFPPEPGIHSCPGVTHGCTVNPKSKRKKMLSHVIPAPGSPNPCTFRGMRCVSTLHHSIFSLLAKISSRENNERLQDLEVTHTVSHMVVGFRLVSPSPAAVYFPAPPLWSLPMGHWWWDGPWEGPEQLAGQNHTKISPLPWEGVWYRAFTRAYETK